MLPATDAQTMMAYETHKKDMVIAYLLWYFLGVFGGHRFYCESLRLSLLGSESLRFGSRLVRKSVRLFFRE